MSDGLIWFAPQTDDERRAKWKERTGLDGTSSIKDCTFMHLTPDNFAIHFWPDGRAYVRFCGLTIAPVERTIVTAEWIVRLVNRCRRVVRRVKRVRLVRDGGE